jgi:hypothetical protein
MSFIKEYTVLENIEVSKKSCTDTFSLGFGANATSGFGKIGSSSTSKPGRKPNFQFERSLMKIPGLTYHWFSRFGKESMISYFITTLIILLWPYYKSFFSTIPANMNMLVLNKCHPVTVFNHHRRSGLFFLRFCETDAYEQSK